VMVTSLEHCEGPFSFHSSSGSATCPDSLSSVFAYRGSSALKWDTALPLLAFRRCSVLRFRHEVLVFLVSAKCRASMCLDVVKVTVRPVSWIAIRTCITAAFAVL
jgi:hypothetical protein